MSLQHALFAPPRLNRPALFRGPAAEVDDAGGRRSAAQTGVALALALFGLPWMLIARNLPPEDDEYAFG